MQLDAKKWAELEARWALACADEAARRGVDVRPKIMTKNIKVPNDTVMYWTRGGLFVVGRDGVARRIDESIR